MAAWTPSRVDAPGDDDDSSRGGYSYRDAEFYPPVEGERGDDGRRPAGVKSSATTGPSSRFLVNPLAVAARHLRDRRERRAAARRDADRADRDARESAAAERLRARRETLSGARGAFFLARAVEASRGALLSALDRACVSANLDDAGLRPGDVLVPAARGGAAVAAFAPPAGRSPLPRAYFLERGHLDILIPDRRAPAPAPAPTRPRDAQNPTYPWRVAFTLGPGAFFTHPLAASLPGVPDDAEIVVATPGARVHACALDRLRAGEHLRVADQAYAELRETALAYVPAFRALEKTEDGAWTARLVADLFETEEHAPRGVVSRAGDAEDALRVVVRGEVFATVPVPVRDANGREKMERHRRGVGDHWGDVALATDAPAAARVSRARAVAGREGATTLALRRRRIETILAGVGANSPLERAFRRARLDLGLGPHPNDDPSSSRGIRTDAETGATARDDEKRRDEKRSDASRVATGAFSPPPPPLGHPGGPVPDLDSKPKGSRRKAELRAALARSLVFEGASDALLDKTVAEFVEIRLRPGETLCRSGDAPWGLCVVESGALDLWRAERPGAPPTHLGRLGRGYVHGEIPSVFGVPARADAIAAASGRDSGPGSSDVVGCRLWGISAGHLERATGVRDERGRRREHAAFVPFPSELAAFDALEATQLEHQAANLARAAAGEAEVRDEDERGRPRTAMERCMRALPDSVGGTLLERIVKMRTPAHGREAEEERRRVERTRAAMREAADARWHAEERERASRERDAARRAREEEEEED